MTFAGAGSQAVSAGEREARVCDTGRAAHSISAPAVKQGKGASDLAGGVLGRVRGRHQGVGPEITKRV